MNNIYIEFIIKKFSLLESSEYILLVFLFVLFLSIILSFFTVSVSSRNSNLEKNKLLKTEKLLFKLKTSFENGQINANEYKTRIINLTKNNKY
jgi:uncharacterized membrane protein